MEKKLPREILRQLASGKIIACQVVATDARAKRRGQPVTSVSVWQSSGTAENLLCSKWRR